MDNIKRLALGVGIAFGVSISSFALYLLLKQEKEDFDIHYNPSLDTSHHITVQMKIPFKAVGYIIGKSGEVIKSIQNKTGTKINFNQKKDSNNLEQERYLTIKGSSNDVKTAERLINCLLDEQSELIMDTFIIDANDIGIIIGKNGATIRAFCEESGAKIKVWNRDKNQIPFLELRGTHEQVNHAKQLINEKLAKRKLKTLNGSKASLQEVETNLNALNMFESLTPIMDNGCVEVYVSAVCSPSKFWVQLFGNHSIELDRLVDEMTEFYESPENQEMTQVHDLKLGDIVAAAFTPDKRWYRVKVVDISDAFTDNLITVKSLDFGDSFKILRNSIRSLNSSYLFRLKFQAIECRLNGIEIIKGENDWSEGAINYFTQITYASYWKQILAKPVHIISKDDEMTENVYIIDLIDINQAHDVNIADDLIAKGFAKRSNRTHF